MRKIHEVTGPQGIAKVYRDNEWSEWRVRFYTLEGVHMKSADYHTDDKVDALQTAEAGVKPTPIPWEDFRNLI